jgi:hypothetical protein
MRTTLLLALAFTGLAAAKHCYNLDENGKTGIAWDPSHDCCMGPAFGVWVSKDCKVRMVGREHTERITDG